MYILFNCVFVGYNKKYTLKNHRSTLAQAGTEISKFDTSEA